MASNLVRRLVGASLGLVVVMSAARPAGAQEAASITVVPSVGLSDGQTVTVEGTGFAPNTSTFGSLTVGLCPADVLTDVALAPYRCGAALAFPVAVDDSGAFVAQLQVFRSQPTFLGEGTLTCADAPSDCVVLALEVTGSLPDVELIAATAPITFRPETKADCRRGGWRNFTDDLGRPFPDQGACVRFVVTDGAPGDR
ncbi:MAG TPA: neocarzinostatin apoprotein domain-containing protein [Acidimicrobiales bacterium]|nr:neocarzinostatin apoprotein domain-containing protein [Acidimicrobiales bacterium]